MTRLTASDIDDAARRFDDPDIVQPTPVEYSRTLSERTGGEVHLKMEHLQRTGSFKTRGAYRKLLTLSERDDVGEVIAASAGNHAQGVALAATKTGIPATIVMPTTAPQSKIEATEGYGANVVLEGLDFGAAVDHARTLADRDGTAFVHAFDDPDIVAGQGTVALEIVEDVPDVDTVVVPIGGGGLIAGIGAALAEYAPDVRIVGVQAESAATVPESLDKGEPLDIDDPNTIADGIATGGTSSLTLDLIDEHVDQVVTVSDAEIASGVVLLLERAKQLVEGAGAAPVAALLSDRLDVADETVVPVLSGGNLDMSMLQTLLTHELTSRSQLIRLRVRIDDEPGKMAQLSTCIAERGANIRTVHHYRANDSLSVGEAYLVFLVETSGASHASGIIETIEDEGYDVERVN
ncbi:threonine ammonia-lyase [Natronococcus pandeyae]|uniref:threonine ammonia-lyase n=1 Tax=Natronococcus pandeyae TaxID=2055836 RepID=A0A8J8Q3L6_9EURY|nr:threonine ammonia-lyase [Natronococcus pandeyae]TYL37963.1 threonine ammonia-lyase [Natronococcus pandeyae]